MPSDDRAAAALRALAAPRERFHSAVAAAVDEVRGFLAAHRPAHDGRAASAAAVELGAFAGGRIDASRFAALAGGAAPLDASALAPVEAALAELVRVAAAGDALFRVEVRHHADFHLTVAHALASAGRAFAAAQVVELVRAGRWDPEAHTHLLAPFPYRRWNRAERAIAPPLVIEAEGAALHAGALAEFMDGAQTIVLVVHAPAPPAALARLVTPGVFVMQTDDAAQLARAAAFDGPAVAALVPEGAARFVHDPSAGGTLRARLTIDHLPDGGALRGLDGYSAFQQRDELAWLREMTTVPSAQEPVPSAREPVPSAQEPVPSTADAPLGTGHSALGTDVPDADLLAAFLLRQAGL